MTFEFFLLLYIIVLNSFHCYIVLHRMTISTINLYILPPENILIISKFCLLKTVFNKHFHLCTWYACIYYSRMYFLGEIADLLVRYEKWFSKEIIAVSTLTNSVWASHCNIFQSTLVFSHFFVLSNLDSEQWYLIII